MSNIYAITSGMGTKEMFVVMLTTDHSVARDLTDRDNDLDYTTHQVDVPTGGGIFPAYIISVGTGVHYRIIDVVTCRKTAVKISSSIRGQVAQYDVTPGSHSHEHRTYYKYFVNLSYTDYDDISNYRDWSENSAEPSQVIENDDHADDDGCDCAACVHDRVLSERSRRSLRSRRSRTRDRGNGYPRENEGYHFVDTFSRRVTVYNGVEIPSIVTRRRRYNDSLPYRLEVASTDQLKAAIIAYQLQKRFLDGDLCLEDFEYNVDAEMVKDDNGEWQVNPTMLPI